MDIQTNPIFCHVYVQTLGNPERMQTRERAGRQTTTDTRPRKTGTSIFVRHEGFYTGTRQNDFSYSPGGHALQTCASDPILDRTQQTSDKKQRQSGQETTSASYQQYQVILQPSYTETPIIYGSAPVHSAHRQTSSSHIHDLPFPHNPRSPILPTKDK